MKPKANVFSAACPSRRVFEVLAEKWSLLIVDQLRSGPMRTGEIRRAVGGVSEKMLIQTLRKLERYGLISRQSFATLPPHVEYRLTRLGASLARMANAFGRWVGRNIGGLLKAEASCERKAG
jgi:DNA-binding HxlR family transcriptional regulator